MASRTPARPRSPHLFSGFMKLHYSWGPHMLVSILHRATGSGMATVGTLAMMRFLRPVCYQDVPDALLPPALQDANPWGLTRRVEGKLEVAA